jgi:hypothetical protein
MNRNKNEIEEILNSLDGMRPATANVFLFEKIKAKLDSRQRYQGSKTVVRCALVGAVVLVALNVFTWTQTSQNGRRTDELTAVAGGLGFSNTSYEY